MKRTIQVMIVAFVTLLLVSGGAVNAQDDEPGDPAALCADAGGEWDEATQTCFDVWCGWEDDPAICEWMGGEAVVPPDDEPAPLPTDHGDDAPDAQPVQPDDGEGEPSVIAPGPVDDTTIGTDEPTIGITG